MGCVFEAAKEQQPHKPRSKQLRRNQCRGKAAAGTRGKAAVRANEKPAEDIKIKDNYQQNHKTQTETQTEAEVEVESEAESEAQTQSEAETVPEHLKATAQVLLTIRQARQENGKHGSQVAETHKDEGAKDALATTPGSIVDTTARIGIDIAATTTQIAERDEDEQHRQHHTVRRRRRQDPANPTSVSKSPAAIAGTSALSLHFQALAALAKTLQKQNDDDDEVGSPGQDRQPIAYRPWQGHPYAESQLPATMSAAIIANVSATAAATSAAAFQYLGQHYKHYSQSISFYAASSVILMLCYLTTASTAATQSETGALDKHPIHGIDWSKFDESSSDKEILDLLLEKKRYDKRLLPPVNDEDFCCGLQSPDMATNQNARRPHNRGTLTVNVNVLLLSLASPDESSLKYEVEFLLNQQWNDPRLQYGNKSHYDFLNALHHHDSIWTPDTYFIMHGDFKDPIIPMHFALRIFRNGTITYAMRRHLILSCQGSLHIFPFDDPKCSFSMESISYEEAQIKYVWKNDEDTLRKSPSLTTLNAYLIKNQTTACDQNSWRGNYSCLQVELTFTRDRAYYFTTVFIPGIILVTSSFITFWLEWNAVPARVMIGVTTMLNFFTTSNGFRSTLPVVSNLTAMNVWDGVCMCFIYASLLEFVCVNYVGRKRPLHNVVYRPGENPVTQRLPAVLSRIGVILASPLPFFKFTAVYQGEKRREAGAPNEIVACTTCGGSNSPCTHSANNGCATETCFVQVRKKEPPHPIRVAKTIDVIARITFPTAYAIFLIFFFVHYKGFS
ncbi:glutamate-gated chloride channel isoform X11 [Drosophila subpulchrella]|uniref:glutamate-gated chloride channel isoform X11 n=1 Tax=Drosophila subpulchrella TaxID=1486046 RepID=UPI0018A12B95|nr:glutamate-gated chloride channel isoform X11 [Drosophila subpulchrella]